jgi:hypothetical protein
MVNEQNGLDFGRSLENRTCLRIDPFNRGASPHIITFGISRAGKARFAHQAVEHWCSGGEDRTVFALDTRGVFDNLIETLDGKRITPSGFKQGQKYEYQLDENTTGLMDEDVDMAYLDLRQFLHSDVAEKSTLFRLMLDQVAQRVKCTEAETIILIDEAHILLHSEEMVNWLQKAVREWARCNACLWFISAFPSQFLQSVAGVSDDGIPTSKKMPGTIYEQCSTMQFFRTPREPDETLAQFGLNPNQSDFVRTQATPGGITAGHTEYLLGLADQDGWLPGYIELSSEEVIL